MATSEVFSNKKKNKLRSRFLPMQRSLDISTASAATGSNPSLSEVPVGKKIGKSLFRRSRSEDRMKNGQQPTTEPEQQPYNNATTTATTLQHSSELPGDTTEVNGSSRSTVSPPPPYETYTAETGSTGPMRQSPPSYDEVMMSSTTYDGEDVNRGVTENGSVYCNCAECQQRNFAGTEDEDRNEDGSDVVFPMETHVLMQEVLADGMAFCTVM